MLKHKGASQGELILTDVYKGFGLEPVLKGIDLVLQRGKLIGVIGPSGVGKSVLFKLMGQVMAADHGSIDFAELAPDEISLMFQEGALFDSLSVFDNVAFPLVQGRVPSERLDSSRRDTVRAAVSKSLASVGLTAAAFKFPAQISGGMRRRVSLARALVCQPKLALLDDPTCGLDPVASSVIMELIIEMHKKEGPAVLIASHDLRRLLPRVDEIIALMDGEVAFQGSLHELAELRDSELGRFVSGRFDLGQYVKS